MAQTLPPVPTIVAALILTACSGSGLVTYACDPPCPEGSRCSDHGCVADGSDGGADLAVADLAAGCEPACTGATPHCGSDHTCVACLVDDHCPLGQVCAAIGATRQCVPGCSDDARCGGAVRCCAGLCADTATDPGNCGACQHTCAAAHATAGCAAGACSALACDPGWGDCDGQAADGCEADLAIDSANCGSCGRACALDHALSACGNGCFIAACRFGWDDCNADSSDGCETSVIADTRNCGACGHACAGVPHAHNGCVQGLCLLTSCDPGFADCDGGAANGCEVNTGNDIKNCGACGNACGKGLVCFLGLCTCPMCQLPHARSGCINNQCSIVSCLPGYSDCDGQAKNGCEVASGSDPRNCGACGTVCDKATPACIKGLCQPGCVYGAAVLLSNPIGYWSLDELKGNVVADQAANPHAGSILGAPQMGVAGVAGTAMLFHGNDDQIRVGAVTSSTTSEVSYEFWVWIDALPNSAITVIWDDDGQGGGDSWIEITPAGNLQTHRSPDGFMDFLSAGSVNVSAWNHVAMVIDANGKTFYLNGVLDSSTNVQPGLPRTGRSYVTIAANYDGVFYPGGAQFFNGTIDEMAIYDHALTADEVTAHYNASCAM